MNPPVVMIPTQSSPNPFIFPRLKECHVRFTDPRDLRTLFSLKTDRRIDPKQ
jgi:hypothetical protein